MQGLEDQGLFLDVKLRPTVQLYLAPEVIPNVYLSTANTTNPRMLCGSHKSGQPSQKWPNGRWKTGAF